MNLRLAGLPALAVILATAPSPAAPPLVAPPQSRMTWDLSVFSWIKRQPAEKGAPPNGHPWKVGAADLEKALAAMRLFDGKREEALFSPAEAGSLGKALAEAFALAQPAEDLVLLSTANREGGFIGTSTSVTARLFYRDGNLNFIVHDARLDFLIRENFGYVMPEFEYGSRKSASPVSLRSAAGKLVRQDWLEIPIKPATAAATAAPQAPPASVEERLRALQRLREQGLITEEEYAAKRKDILKEL